MPAGRPSKLTPEIEKRVLDLIRAGNALETACLASGVNSKTLRRWRELGRGGRQPYASFGEKLQQAQAEAEVMFNGLLNQASTGYRIETIPGTTKTRRVPVQGDWRAKAFWAERMLARRWGAKVRLEIDTALEAFVAHLKASLAPEVFDQVFDAAQSFSGVSASEDGDGWGAAG